MTIQSINNKIVNYNKNRILKNASGANGYPDTTTYPVPILQLQGNTLPDQKILLEEGTVNVKQWSDVRGKSSLTSPSNPSYDFTNQAVYFDGVNELLISTNIAVEYSNDVTFSLYSENLFNVLDTYYYAHGDATGNLFGLYLIGTSVNLVVYNSGVLLVNQALITIAGFTGYRDLVLIKKGLDYMFLITSTSTGREVVLYKGTLPGNINDIDDELYLSRRKGGSIYLEQSIKNITILPYAIIDPVDYSLTDEINFAQFKNSPNL